MTPILIELFKYNESGRIVLNALHIETMEEIGNEDGRHTVLTMGSGTRHIVKEAAGDIRLMIEAGG